MDGKSTRDDYTMLESLLQNPCSEPLRVPLEYLRKITNNFSDKQLLGEGSFGKVYKGVLQNARTIAVKKFEHLKPGVQERHFQNEVYHLMKLKHPNIVRLVGYSYEIWNECVEYNGKPIFAEMHQRLLCLEYLPNGSLDGHLSDESSGLDWRTRFRILKGICCGLHYLHEECKCQINASLIHLDLKPANILLDANMVPKVADFGLSRLFEDKKTQTCTSNPAGSFGYMAPEYLYRNIITTKADIYSLGVIIIEIITGRRVDPFFSVTKCQDFIESVLKCWRIRLEASPTYRVETECQQLGSCLEIGLTCTKFNYMERPSIGEIIEKLNNLESTSCSVAKEERLPAHKNNRKRKQPISSGPTNSTDTSPSVNSPPSTPSTTHPLGDGLGMVGNMRHVPKNLMMYGADGTGLASSKQTDDLELFVDVGSLDDNVISFASNDDGDGMDISAAVEKNPAEPNLAASKGFTFSCWRTSHEKVVCCHFSSDGKVLARAGHSKKVVLWNMDDFQTHDMPQEHALVISDVHFRPNSSQLATSSFDRTIKLWNAADPGFFLHTFTGHNYCVLSLDFHPRKTDLLCSCDGSGEIRYWNVSQLTCMHAMKGGLMQVRFQPNAGQFLAASIENIISIFDIEKTTTTTTTTT